MTEFISIESLTLDPSLQPRVELDQATVNRYTEAFKQGEAFPAVVVFRDEDVLWLADGFHRVAGAIQAGLTFIEADVRTGTKIDALVHSASANDKHGLPRTQADKRKAVLSLLAYPEFQSLSDRELGRICRVDHKTVAQYRKDSSGEFPTQSVHSQEVVDFFHGKLWLNERIYAALSPIHQAEIKPVVVAEVRQMTHKLKALGWDGCSPITIWGTCASSQTMIQIASIDGHVWWAAACNDDDGPTAGFHNRGVTRGFDGIIWFLYHHGGPVCLPSQMDDLFLGKPPEPMPNYWDDLIFPFRETFDAKEGDASASV